MVISETKERMQLGGVYKIVHIPTGLYYLGSTHHFKKRFFMHRRELRAGRHCNPKLQNFWIVKPENDFEFRIVEITDNLLNREQYYLDLWKPYQRKVGFNVRQTARGFSSEEVTRNKLLYWENLKENPKEYAIRIQQLKEMSSKGNAASLQRIKEDAELRAVLAQNAAKARSVPRKRWNTDHSPKTIHSISQKIIALWADPAYRAKQVAARKQRKCSISLECPIS